MKHYVLGAAFLMFVSSLPADADRGSRPERPPAAPPKPMVLLKTFGDALPPIGYVNFCQQHEAECRPSGQFADRIKLTAATRKELDRINRHVNKVVGPATDLELYGKVEVWTYPGEKGDCEDYVLLKRRLLIERGWPESALLITVVRDENNEGHAVLNVKTDKGDLVLDNKRQEIVPWDETPYTFIKQQSNRDPLIWASLLPPDRSPQTPVSASYSN